MKTIIGIIILLVLWIFAGYIANDMFNTEIDYVRRKYSDNILHNLNLDFPKNGYNIFYPSSPLWYKFVQILFILGGAISMVFHFIVIWLFYIIKFLINSYKWLIGKDY